MWQILRTYFMSLSNFRKNLNKERSKHHRQERIPVGCVPPAAVAGVSASVACRDTRTPPGLGLDTPLGVGLETTPQVWA